MNRKERRAQQSSTDPNTNTIYQQALQQHQQKNYREAEEGYRKILQLYPNNPEILHLLGLCMGQQGKNNEAQQLLERAITINPDNYEYYSNLAVVLKNIGDSCGVIKNLQYALEIKPDFTNAIFNLGNEYFRRGQFTESIKNYRKVIELNPNFPGIYLNIAGAYKQNKEYAEAELYYKKVLSDDHENIEALNNLSIILYISARFDEALGILNQLVKKVPESPEIHNNLALILREKGLNDQAITELRTAIKLKPDYADAYNNLGLVFQQVSKLSAAIDNFDQAIKLRPDYYEAYNNKSVVLQQQGFIEEAIINARRALEIRPDYLLAHSNMLFMMHYDTSVPQQVLFEEAVNLGKKYNQVPTVIKNHDNKRVENKRLHIGYVSGDFKNHPVGYFIEKVISNHNRDEYKIFCYSNYVKVDELTTRLKASSNWRDIYSLNDNEAASLIVNDGIDILIDLSGHTVRNRLPLFAKKPAPIQASWMGYFDTTGVPAIDYIIADKYVISHENERFFTEKVLRLPDTYLCFDPPHLDIEVAELPAITNKHITFGCFNNATKINSEVIKCWSKILSTIEGSTLFLNNLTFSDGTVRARIISEFEKNNIDASRLKIEGGAKREALLADYNQVDIALDPFPYNGGTTTVESLWMGVPVISLAGKQFVERVGLSILSATGLSELVATNDDEYIKTACGLAGSNQRLSGLRQELRSRLLRSPLCNDSKFIKNLEGLYRDIWKNWCHKS